MKQVIYKITNKLNNKCYIGSTIHFAKRISEHKRALRASVHHSMHLQAAWNKYGEAAFLFEIIQNVTDKAHLIAYEQVFLDYYQSYIYSKGYNILRTAGSPLGNKMSHETKNKISAAKKGKKFSKKTRANIYQRRLDKLDKGLYTHYCGGVKSGNGWMIQISNGSEPKEYIGWYKDQDQAFAAHRYALIKALKDIE